MTLGLWYPSTANVRFFRRDDSKRDEEGAPDILDIQKNMTLAVNKINEAIS
jgi:hypothetical protein